MAETRLTQTFDAFGRLDSLRGRTAWVTGAGRGIGRAVAFALARAGASVALGARTRDDIESVADALAAEGHEAPAIELDVADKDSCKAFADKAKDRFGNVDILVNNAAIGIMRPIDKFQDDEFERQFRINVFGPYYMVREAIDGLRANGGGNVVNVSSLAGESFAQGGTGYFSTKWALNGFSKCLFEDLRNDNIKVTVVAPGSVDTRFHTDSRPGSHTKDQDWMATPEQVANAVLMACLMPGTSMVGKIDVRPVMKPKK